MAAQTFALQVVVVLLVVGIGTAAGYVQARRAVTDRATAQAAAVARTMASTPSVVAGVRSGDPGHALEPLAEAARRSTHTDFVVIMSPQGVRYTHPDPNQIGRRFVGHIAAAVAGGEVVEDYTGTLGPSRRVVVPVQDPAAGNAVVGLVAVGIAKPTVARALRGQIPGIVLAGLGAALLCGLGTALVARRVRRQTRGLGARELQDMYEYYDAVLHAVREGLLLTDPDGRLRLANDEAARLLGIAPDAAGTPVAELGLPEPLVLSLTDDRPRSDELHVTDARVLVLNKAPAQWQGRPMGFVTTLRDRTDLQHLTGELDSARGLAEALRSQAHESSNRLHTIISLIELGHPGQALEFATEELGVSQLLTDAVVGAAQEPTLASLLLGKAAEAHERGIDFRIVDGLQWPADAVPAREVVTIVGNLVDNAFDAVSGNGAERQVEIGAQVVGGRIVLTVADTGPGLPPDAVDDAFRRGFTTKADRTDARRGIGLALVAQSVSRLGGDLAVDGPPGARFTVRIPIVTSDG